MWRSFAAKVSPFRRLSYLILSNHTSKVSPTTTQSYHLHNHTTNPRLSLLSHTYSTETWKLDSTATSADADNEYDPTITSGVFDHDDDVSAATESDVLGEESVTAGYADVSVDAVVGEEEAVCETENKLESVVSLLQSGTDLSLESTLNGLELELDENFVVSVLQTELIPGENLLAFFNLVRKNHEFVVTMHVLETFVTAISVLMRKKYAYAVWDIVKEIGEKDSSVLNVGILNQLIALVSKLGKGKAGYEVYSKFEEFGFTPNEDTYFLTIEALCRRSFYKWALTIVEKMMESGFVPDDERLGNIISWLCKGKLSKEAHSVYLLGKQKGRQPSTASVNFLISSLSRKDDYIKLALEMLDDLSEEARKYGIKPFTSVLRGLCRTKDVEEAKKLLNNMIESGPPPSNGVFNFVIDALSKSGEMDEAKRIVKLMESRGLKPDVYTYTTIISGYTKGGQMEDAMEVLSEAKTKHSKLSHVTYHTLIRGYCKLEEYDKAVKLVHEMKDFGVEANADEYNKLIRSLCMNAADWKTAEALLDEMNEKGLHLYGMTKGLVNAVRDLEAESLGIEEKEAHTIAA